MDPVQILTAAGIPHAVAWGGLIVAISSVLAAWLPHPAPTSPWALPRNALDTLAFNWGRAANATPPATGGTTLPLGALLGLVLLAGCNLTPAQQQQLVTVAQVACQVDGAAQPVLVSLAPLAGPGGVQAATLDSALAHPLVMAACAQVAGKPAAVVPLATPPAG